MKAVRYLPLAVLLAYTTATAASSAVAFGMTAGQVAAVCQVPVGPGGHPAVCMDAFFEVLQDYGTWIATDRFGTLFCPHPAVFGLDFRPYTKGHWVMSESGWTFVGETPVSWVTDHYGRWVSTGLSSCPWGWVPGDVWSPAWVEFRVGESVIAWRPAPFDGIPVQLHVPPGNRLQEVHVPPLAVAARPGSPFHLDDGYVAVQDGDFEAARLQEVTLSGPDLHNALAQTAFFPDARAGLHSRTRNEIVAQLQAAQEVQRVAEELKGEPPAPAARVSHGRSKAVAGTVQAGHKGREGTGPKPGDNPPGTGKVYGPSDPNQGNFQQPGPPGGIKVLEWGKPKPKQPPQQPPPE